MPLSVLKVIGVTYIVFISLGFARSAIHRRGGDAPKPSLYGLYQVEEFVREGRAVPRC